MIQKYNTTTLAGGLRVIHLWHPSPVVFCGFQVAAGSRNEQPGEEGLAHFCEHLTFKGTARRSSMQILNALESVGGDLNAYTNKEDTTFYCAIQKSHIRKAVDLLADIVFSSIYPQPEIEKEVEVVCDEIESYNDSPAELIYDEFENLLFRGHPLGHNILGEAARLRQYTHDDALRFAKSHYRPANAVFFVYGDVDFGKTCRLLESIIGKWHENVSSAEIINQGITISTDAQTYIFHRGTHQAHVMAGTTAYSATDDNRRIALYLLNNYLGGPGMNARLNLALRERNALVYTVESSMVSYGDTGAWSVYFGCDQHDVKRCLKLVRHELDKLVDKPMTEGMVNRAREQLKGQIAIGCDNREQFALDFGRIFLHHGKERYVEDLYNHLDALTPALLQNVAQEIFNPDRMITLIYE